MFDVGFTELFLLALIGLMVIGPERLPGVARTLGGFVRKARTSWNSLRNSIEAELAEADISASIKQAHEGLKSIGEELSGMPDFTPENRISKATKPEPESVDPQQAGPAQDPDSAKSKHV
jgi:sec-independent protein translocase protein TatB